MKVKKRSWVKHSILTISIALVLVFFVAYAIESIYPSPKWEDYCGDRDKGSGSKTYLNQSSCEANGGRWNPYIGRPSLPSGETGFCDAHYTCQKEYDNDKEIYERNIFFVNLVFGLIILGVSFMLAVEVVSNGLMSAGAILIVYGTLRNWSNLSSVWRTIMLGFALFVLIWIGYKKLKD